MPSVTPPAPITSPPTSILVAIDYSEVASVALQRAIAMAKRGGAEELHFLHVNHGDQDEAAQELHRAELMSWLEARLTGINAVPEGVRVIAHEANGEPAWVIAEMANDLRVETVIVGAHPRRGRERMPASAVAQTVVRDCGCAVFVVRSPLHEQPPPHLELPCPRCLELRQQSRGDTLWCEQHREKHGRCHIRFNPRALAPTSHRMLS